MHTSFMRHMQKRWTTTAKKMQAARRAAELEAARTSTSNQAHGWYGANWCKGSCVHYHANIIRSCYLHGWKETFIYLTFLTKLNFWSVTSEITWKVPGNYQEISQKIGRLALMQATKRPMKLACKLAWPNRSCGLSSTLESIHTMAYYSRKLPGNYQDIS